VSFYVCGPQTAGACTSTSTSEGTVNLVGATSDTSTATSITFTPTTTGAYCFAAIYNPQPGGNYTGSADNNSSSNIDPDECFTVGASTPPPPPATSTTTSSTTSTSSVTIAKKVAKTPSVLDTATVTGSSSGGQPQGTVNFYLCGPLTAAGACTSTSLSEGTVTLAGATSDSSSATSSPYQPTTAGTYCFAAVFTPASGSSYTGSASNNSTSNTSSTECFTAVASTTRKSGHHHT